MLWQENMYGHMNTAHTSFCCQVALQVLYIFKNENVMQELADSNEKAYHGHQPVQYS